MKINENVAILGPRVTLVPYEPRHVAKYHQWMSDPAIQEATASEPLTLEEEYENQASWRRSHDKLTFILCQPLSDGDGGGDGDGANDGRQVEAGVLDREDRMIGDVNFFLYPYDAGEGEEEGDFVGEVDVMVAEAGERGRGVGFGAVTGLMNYVYRHAEGIIEEHRAGLAAEGGGERGREEEEEEEKTAPRLRSLMAKIKQGNDKSIALFRRIGFVQKGGVNYFGELEMVLDDSESFMDRVAKAGDDGSGPGPEVPLWAREMRETYQEVVYVRR